MGAGYQYWGQGPSPGLAAKAPARTGVPVSVTVVTRRDVPIYLSGLGTVQAVFTVGIHSQVDGKLQEVLKQGVPVTFESPVAGQSGRNS